MNWAPPQWIRDATSQAMDEDIMVNHYAHPRGRPRLVKAISEHYSPSFENLAKEGRKLKPEEIIVTAGANGGELLDCLVSSSCAGNFETPQACGSASLGSEDDQQASHGMGSATCAAPQLLVWTRS